MEHNTISKKGIAFSSIKYQSFKFVSNFWKLLKSGSHYHVHNLLALEAAGVI